ncbi:MAG: hypothetical protein AAF467_19620 [Actinomycetota bacterium]
MPEGAFLDLVQQVRDGIAPRSDLVELLAEDSDAFAGRSARDAARRRGWVLATFESVGLPPPALPAVLDELRSACDPYVTAAAARALRGATHPPGHAADVLVSAFDAIRRRDDDVTFDAFRPNWKTAAATSALTEILLSLRHVGSASAATVDRLRGMRTDVVLSPRVSSLLQDVVRELDTATRAVVPATGVPSTCRPTSAVDRRRDQAEGMPARVGQHAERVGPVG